MYQHALARCLTEKQRAEQKKVTASRLASWKIQNLYGGNYLPTNAWKLLTNPDELFPNAIIQMVFVSKHSEGELVVTGVERNKTNVFTMPSISTKTLLPVTRGDFPHFRTASRNCGGKSTNTQQDLA